MRNKINTIAFVIIIGSLIVLAPAVVSAEEGANQTETASSDKPNKQALEKWNSLTAEQKTRLRDAYRRFSRLDPERQKKIRMRLRRFKSMSQKERQRLRRNFEKYKELPIQKRQESKKPPPRLAATARPATAPRERSILRGEATGRERRIIPRKAAKR